MPTIVSRSVRVTALSLLGSAAFAAVYGQAPLYYSNQNQYFLHGLAAAGLGLLHEDWLANTVDPTPVFTGLVWITARFLHPWLFHVYHALLQGVYVAALLSLFFTMAGDRGRTRWPVFAALLLLVHSAVARGASYRLLGLDYPWYLQTGVAAQYLLGPMLQPSAFGVLLLAAVALFVRRRYNLAALALAAAVTVHFTYFLPAALLGMGFLTADVGEDGKRRAHAVGLACLLLLPVTIYVLLAFSETTPKVAGLAQSILVNDRLPHHARPDRWFDAIAGLQVGWIVLGIVLTWRTRLFRVLLVPFVFGLVLTLMQAAVENDALALLFPWRVSAVLVPLATTVILTRLVTLSRLPLDGHAAWAASALVALGLVVGGLWISLGRQAFLSSEEELPMMTFVRDTCRSGDVYFLPVQVPDLGRKKGALSNDFKPLPDRKADPREITPDLLRFRLFTGAPIYVDFKSIPYKDVEVIEWRERLRWAEEVQKRLQSGDAAALAELRARGLTHLVVPAARAVNDPAARLLYADDYYRVYHLEPDFR
jgi:hypothetical protein